MHFLVIPKQRDGLTRLSKAEERHKQLLGHLLYVAQLVAKQGVLLMLTLLVLTTMATSLLGSLLSTHVSV